MNLATMEANEFEFSSLTQAKGAAIYATSIAEGSMFIILDKLKSKYIVTESSKVEDWQVLKFIATKGKLSEV